MDHISTTISGNSTYYILCALFGLFILLAANAAKLLKRKNHSGFILLLLSMFCISLHGFILYTLPIDNMLSFLVAQMDLYLWVSLMVGPTVIILFIAISLVNIFQIKLKDALLRLFFGLSLLGYLYLFGGNFDLMLKSLIIMFFTFCYFFMELKTDAPVEKPNLLNHQ